MPEHAFLLPDLGEGLESAELVEWRVAVGQEVTVDDPLVEVETAKANVEIPSPYTGTVIALHAQAGEEVAVGALLITIAVTDADGAGRAPARPLVGYGTAPEARAPAAAAAPARALAPATGTRVLASPPVRRRAREAGIDLAGIPGNGPGGAVTHADLDRSLAGGGARNDGRTAAEPAPSVRGTRVPVRGVRRLVAERLGESRRVIPDASTWVDCDAGELLALRAAIAERHPGVKVTPLVLVVRACIVGLRRFPALNARYHDASEEIEYLEPIHLGFAAQTDRGLVVPVIRDAHTRTTLELAAELHRLAAAARDGSITPAELAGSTFTVSNYGAFGVDGGVAIINPPEAAILGVGRFVPRPWVHEGAVVIRSVVQLSLSFDHRIMDGDGAGGFIRFVADAVEEPATLLAEL